MDIGTGYFARLSLDTGSLVSAPFVRAITSSIYGYETTTLNARLNEHTQLAQNDTNATQALDEDFWQAGLLDVDAMVQLED